MLKVTFILESGKTIRHMDMELMYILTVIRMMECGPTTNNKAMELKSGQMVRCTQVNTWTARKMVKVNLCGLTRAATRAILLTTSYMGRASTHGQMDEYLQGSG